MTTQTYYVLTNVFGDCVFSKKENESAKSNVVEIERNSLKKKVSDIVFWISLKAMIKAKDVKRKMH